MALELDPSQRRHITADTDCLVALWVGPPPLRAAAAAPCCAVLCCTVLCHAVMCHAVPCCGLCRSVRGAALPGRVPASSRGALAPSRLHPLRARKYSNEAFCTPSASLRLFL